MKWAPYVVAGFLAVPFVAAQEWSAYGGDAMGTRHSAAAQVTPENVAELEKVTAQVLAIERLRKNLRH